MPYKDKQKQNEYLSKWRQKKKKQFGGWNKAVRKDKLGTTDFDEHLARNEKGEPDFDKEQKEINEELKRLRLCKNR